MMALSFVKMKIDFIFTASTSLFPILAECLFIPSFPERPGYEIYLKTKQSGYEKN
jgi:hypothetical protein